MNDSRLTRRGSLVRLGGLDDLLLERLVGEHRAHIARRQVFDRRFGVRTRELMVLMPWKKNARSSVEVRSRAGHPISTSSPPRRISSRG